MKRFRKSKTLVYVILFALAVSGLLMMTYRSQSVTVLVDVMSGLDKIVGKPFTWVEGTRESFSHLLQTYEENRSLKRELSSERDVQAEIDTLKKENAQLRDLLAMKSLYEGHLSISATVIHRSPLSWGDDLTLDKGSNEKVSNEMVAVVNKGLIGTVEKVATHSSRIHLLTNPKSAQSVAVKIKTTKSEIFGILTGYDSEEQAFIVSQLNQNVSLEKGSKVLTSGLGINHIADIPVGEVLDVRENKDHLTKEVLVKPSADFSDIRVVTLVGE